MIFSRKIKGSVLPTVIMISVLMLLGVLGVLMLWESDFLLSSRIHYLRTQRVNIESAFVLYCTDPSILDRLEADSTLLLYDSLDLSRVKMVRKPWGLYEVVSVSSLCGKVKQSRIMGAERAYLTDCNFWYRDHDGSLTLTGNTNLKGYVCVPKRGVVYGQMKSVFFSGEKIAHDRIKTSEKYLPQPQIDSRQTVKNLFFTLLGDLPKMHSDSLNVMFFDNYTETYLVDEVSLISCYGNIILAGKDIEIKSSATLKDVIVVGENIVIEDGFRGSVQLFARDSVVVGDNVMLGYPSGIYAGQYASLGESSEIDGYLIVDYQGDKNVKRSNGKISRLSKVRGLFYASGIFQLQGIVNGCVFLDEATYYAPHGYYRNILFDATVLENKHVGYPLWLQSGGRRVVIKWVE